MDSHGGRWILAVVAALAVTLGVFRASAAEVPAASELEVAVDEIEVRVGDGPEKVEDEDVVWVYSAGLGERLGATAERQVEILRKLPDDVVKGLFVDLPRKSRAFEAAASVKDPRAISIALAGDFDALGAQLSGVVQGVSAIGAGAGDLLGQLLPGKGTSGGRLPRLTA